MIEIDEQLLYELKSFRRLLNEHDSIVKTNEAINQFFSKKGKEVTIILTANTCMSEIKVKINGSEYNSHDSGIFNLNELVRHAIKEQSK